MKLIESQLQMREQVSYWKSVPLLAVFLLTPWILSDYYLYYANITLVYVVIILGLNVIMGFTRMIHLGFAGLVGIGSYGCVSSMMFLKIGYIPSVFVGGIMAAVVGFLLSVPGVRLSELGFALVTLAFGEAVVTILSSIDALGGYNGLMVPQASLFGFRFDSNFRFFFLGYVFAVLLLIAYRNIMRSETGRAFIALADSEVASQSLGVNVQRYQMLASCIGGFYAGVAGSLFGPLVKFIDPSSFGISETLLLLMMIIIGGMGTKYGPILGAALLAFVPELVRGFNEYRTLVYGIALVVIIIALPEGLGGAIAKAWYGIKKGRGRN